MLIAPTLLRIALVIGVVALAVALTVGHGVRGFVVLIAIIAAATIPRTRVFRIVSSALVRLTGSSRRAAVLVGLIIIAIAIAANVYQFAHG